MNSLVGKGCVYRLFGYHILDTPQEFAYQLIDSKATWIVTSEAALPTALKAAEKANISTQQLILIDYKPTTTSYKTVEQIFAEPKVLPHFQPRLSAEDLATKPVVLCYSSGTTGRAKGVMTTKYVNR